MQSEHLSAMLNPAPLVELITPTVAEELLRLNVSNRPLNKRVVEEYAKAMSRGDWLYNGDAIRISIDNVMLDGQHRCHAIIRCGIPQRYVVVRNLPPETFGTIDRPRRRSVSDSLAVLNEKNTARLATALRWISAIEVYGGRNSFASMSPAEAVETLNKHPEVRHWIAMFANSRSLRGLFESYLVSVATLFSEKYGISVVDQFWEQLNSGENLKKGDPAYELRARAIQNRTSTSKLPAYIMVPLIIKAFKAHVTGKKIGVLRYAGSEEWPAI